MAQLGHSSAVLTDRQHLSTNTQFGHCKVQATDGNFQSRRVRQTSCQNPEQLKINISDTSSELRSSGKGSCPQQTDQPFNDAIAVQLGGLFGELTGGRSGMWRGVRAGGFRWVWDGMGRSMQWRSSMVRSFLWEVAAL